MKQIRVLLIIIQLLDLNVQQIKNFSHNISKTEKVQFSAENNPII